jgi:hypothetical protein
MLEGLLRNKGVRIKLQGFAAVNRLICMRIPVSHMLNIYVGL